MGQDIECLSTPITAYRKLFRGWQEITDMKVNLHSCGSIDTILPDLIECGVQVVNPVQVSAKNMGPASLKERFGNDVVFWGGAYDVQLMNDRMTYDEVYRAVRENIRTLGAGGNYIFSGVHNLPATMPEHHLKAMIDAYRDTRDYR